MIKAVNLLVFVSLALVSAQDASNEEPVWYFDCVAPCAVTEFCGSDLQCHGYSCEAWYELGHPFFTGRPPKDEPPIQSLLCEDATEDRSFLQTETPCLPDLPLAGEFIVPDGVSRSCFDPYAEDQLASYFMTRKCTAQPTNETGFECYDISPNTDMEVHTYDYVEQSQGQNGSHIYKLVLEGYMVSGSTAPRFIDFRSLGGEADASVFNLTVARSTMYSRAFRIVDTDLPNCGTGCLLYEFCGNDGACHDIDCDNFFLYGPEAFIGPTMDVDYSCSTSQQQHMNSTANYCESGWPVAVKYFCRPEKIFSYPGVCLDADEDTRHLSFYRMCTARPTPTQEFVCFDMKGVPDLTVYASDYINSTANNALCKEDEKQSSPEDGQPWRAYHYQTHQIENYQLSTSLYLKAPYQAASTEPLDFDALEHALYARLVGFPPEENDDFSLPSASGALQQIPWKGTLLILSILLLV